MNNSKFWNSNTNNVPTKSNFSINSGLKKSSGIGGALIVVLVFVAALAVLGYVVAIAPALSLQSDINILKADGRAISTALKDRDLVALDKNLNKTEKDLNTLRQNRDKKIGWAKNVGVFKISEFYSDSDKFINAGLDGIDALREVEKVARPFADAAGLKVEESTSSPFSQPSSGTKDGGLMEAFQTWINLMPQVAGQMDGVIAKVDKIGEDLKDINTSKYPENVKGFALRSNLEFVKNTLSKASEYGPDIKQALIVFPKVLGVGSTEKRYMIIMQNDKELRPTGGFMTNYATFKIRNGLLQSDFSSKDMYSIDLALSKIDATYDFPDPPASYTKYLKVEHWYARDMNSSPDFITSMEQFMKFYNLAGRIDPYEIKPVDGIFAIDTNVISELLKVTGPVTVSGITYTSENVVLELEKIASLELREQANRKKILGQLMEAMLINVFQSDKNLWSKLIDAGVKLSINKHVLIYLFDPEAQALIEKYNFAGRIMEEVPGDYLSVVSTNLGGDKTNWFTHKTVTSSLAKENGKWVRTVQIAYNYTQPSAEYGPFVKQFKDWVRVYAPLGSQVISVDGSEDGTSTDQERNKMYMTGWVTVQPGESKTITFKYSLPDGIVGQDNYSLTIQKQPGITVETYNVVYGNTKQEIKLDKDTVVNVKIK